MRYVPDTAKRKKNENIANPIISATLSFKIVGTQ